MTRENTGTGEYGVMMEEVGADGQLDWLEAMWVDELMHREETDSTEISGRVWVEAVDDLLW